MRRSYFQKVRSDNLQVILFEKKKEQHQSVVSALGIRNDFLAGDVDSEEDVPEGTQVESALSLAVVPENQTEEEKREHHKKLQRYLSRNSTKEKLKRQAIKQFKRNMQRIVKNKRYDPLHLRNRIELQEYQGEIGELVYNESMNEAVYVKRAQTTITQAYAEFQVKINLVNLMVQETLYNWQRFLRTKDSWMGNIHPDETEEFEYYKAHKLDIDEFERQVLTIQQHRSQAHTENRTRELARSQYADDKRLAVFKMVEQINLQTKISTEFLDLLSN